MWGATGWRPDTVHSSEADARAAWTPRNSPAAQPRSTIARQGKSATCTSSGCLHYASSIHQCKSTERPLETLTLFGNAQHPLMTFFRSGDFVFVMMAHPVHGSGLIAALRREVEKVVRAEQDV